MIWLFSRTSESAELTLSSDLAPWPGTEFSDAGATVGNLTNISKKQSCLVAIPKNVGTNPIKGDQGFYLWASDVVYEFFEKPLIKN